MSFKNFCVVENPRALVAKLTKTERSTKTDRDIFEVSLLKPVRREEAKEEDVSTCARTLIYVYISRVCVYATQWSQREQEELDTRASVIESW